MTTRIAHVTTVHSRNDTRIRIKECATVAQLSNVEAILVVQDGGGDEYQTADCVRVVDVGAPPAGRVPRWAFGVIRMWSMIQSLKIDIVHIHDPELIPLGMVLKLARIRVVYDVHEDLPKQILSKFWIPKALRKSLSFAASACEWIAGLSFDAIVVATPSIAARFPKHKSALVQNYPLLNELHRSSPLPMRSRPDYAAYVGGLSAIRGAFQMLDALELLPPECRLRLRLGGDITPVSLREELTNRQGWSRVDDLGWIGRAEVASELASARMGLLLFLPEPNHVSAQPNKMFEYMSAGLPIIASDFPLWRRIITDANCGVLVDPLDPAAIAEAMLWMLENPTEAEAMGLRGRGAIEEKFNWETESSALRHLYVGRLIDPEAA